MVRNRGWLAAGAAVVLPVAALCWMHYRSLGELESKTRVFVRESLRQKLEQVRAEVEARVGGRAGEVLSVFEAGDVARGAALLRAKFSQARALWPEVEEVFLVSGCECLGQPAGSSKAKCAWLDETFRLARRAGNLSYFHYQHAERARCSACHHGEWLDQRESSVYVFRAVEGTAAFAGLRIPARHVTEVVAPAAVAGVRVAGGDSSWSARFVSGPEAEGQVSVPAGALFPLWSLEGEFEGATIHSLARSQLRGAAVMWFSMLACLLAGVAFAMRAAAREAQVAQLKSAFVSNVSHEMKTPLASIRAFAETLEAGRVRDSGRAQEYYRAIHKESLRLSGLIDNVLDLSRLEAGAMRFEARLADAGSLVEEVLEDLRRQPHTAGFEIALEVCRPLPPVRVDRAAMASVVANLVGNAVKYSRAEPWIGVRVEAERDSVSIAVEDRGIGIEARDQRRIFDKFYRANTSLVHDVKGAGLGLALAREIVEAHGGGIRVESRPGEGSTFTVRLPAAGLRGALGADLLAESAHR